MQLAAMIREILEAHDSITPEIWINRYDLFLAVNDQVNKQGLDNCSMQ